MNNSRLWLLFSTTVSIGLGFISGRMITKNRPQPAEPVGHLYEIAGETYLDGALVESLKWRARSHDVLPCGDNLPCPGQWLVLYFRTATIYVKQFTVRQILPQQSGPLYTVPKLQGTSSASRNESEVTEFLQGLIDLDLAKFGGRWKTWLDLVEPGNRLGK